jgi:chorismate dehydratase
MTPVRLAAVSYLNTKPFIYGLYKTMPAGAFELSLDIPSACARKLLADEADLVLTPVAVIPELDDVYLVSDYCIGSVGAVKTVCLYATQPLSGVRRVLLDFHSRTSVALVQMLFRSYWKQDVVFEAAAPGFEQHIGGDTAAVVIGDRTIGLDARCPYVYDLGEAWTAWTGLPFVFAAWVSRRPIDPAFVQLFNQAMQTGIDHLPELIKILPTIPGFDLDAYFHQNISYALDDAKWTGLNHFLSLLSGEKGYALKRSAVFAD